MLVEYLKWLGPSLVALAAFLWALRGGVVGQLRSRVEDLSKRIGDLEDKRIPELEFKLKRAEDSAEELSRKNHRLLTELDEVERLLPPDMKFRRRK